jgi:Transcription-silencing protein Clr2
VQSRLRITLTRSCTTKEVHHSSQVLAVSKADTPAEKRTAKPAEPPVPTDEEGTLDIYKTLVQALYRHRESRRFIDEDVEEKSSMDWRAEHNNIIDHQGASKQILSSHLTYVLLQHSFVPRIGELVLWFQHHPDDVDVVYNPQVGGYQFYSPERQQFHGFPRWQGGVVTQCPSIDENIDFPDVLCVVNRKDSLNRAGFRVETFPDPNDDVDKSASKQCRYVPLRQIRPLNQWQTVLHGIPEKKLDPSITYALTCTVSVSLVEKYRFSGKWPSASIFCKGIYVGAELLIQGDAVKILPSPHAASTGSSECTDVLVISDIRLHLIGIDPEYTNNRSPHVSTKTSITLVGKAYTLDPLRDFSRTTSVNSTSNASPQPIPAKIIKYALPTVGAAAYGDWYALHAPNQKYEISFDRVLGRLYESGAMGMWTGTLGNRKTSDVRPSLSSDLESVLAARRYGTLTDSRIPEVPSGTIKWHWADTRVRALALETVNGVEVGPFHRIRDLRTMQAWRARLKIIDGVYTQGDLKDSMLARQQGRPKGSRIVGGVLVGPDEESEDEEIDPPTRGSFSEAVRSQRGAGGMVGAGAALEEDDDEEDKRASEGLEDDEIEEDRRSMNASKVSIMEQKPDWTSSGFILPEDPDVEVRPPPLPKKRSTSRLSPELVGPTKARKSTGSAKISSIHAGRYDSSITPAMEQETGRAKWKGKGRADTATADWDPDTPFRSVEPDNSIPLDDNNDEDDGDEDTEDEDEEDSLAPAGFVEPDPKDDDDYDDDDEEEEYEDEDVDVDVSDGEGERMQTLANFQKHTFDRAGKKITF